jgi:N-acetylglucosamine-6-sulfatase
VIRGPGIAAGETLDYLASNIDFAPTFADWAGIMPPDFVDGRSLVPLLSENPPAVDSWRHSFLISYWNAPTPPEEPSADSTNEPDPEATQEATPDVRRIMPDFQGLRTAFYTYVEYADGAVELYDLVNDPYQLNNFASTADPDLLLALHNRLEELQTCSAQTCRDAEAKPIAP